MEDRVDLVLVTYNCRGRIAECLDAIRWHTDHPHRLIVVDNASTDGTREYLDGQEDVTRIYNPENAGYGRACNAGARRGDGRLILFLNDDVTVTPGWLSPLVQCMDSDPRIAVVGPKLVDGRGLITGAGVTGTNAAPILRGWQEPDEPGKYGEQTDCLSVCGAAYLIRRDLIPVLGLFDEYYFFYFEETDYSYNARYHGYRVVYCPRSVLIHPVGSGRAGALWDHYLAGQRYFHAKWGAFMADQTCYG